MTTVMDAPFELSDEYFAVVGKMTVAWINAEIPLDLICGILYVRAGGNGIAPSMPKALSQKVRFCRDCFNKLDSVSRLAPAVDQIFTTATRLADERHRVIHGLIDNFTPVSPGRMIIRKIVYETHGHSLETVSTSLAEIENIAKDVLALGAALTLLLRELGKDFSIEFPEVMS